ncbi:MAG: hypothetical protein E6J14_04705 [Chloroflexi bacterium]|nr:MAG: hypothetical protein E6J14_04705 [Chloroflexota bacterium]
MRRVLVIRMRASGGLLALTVGLVLAPPSVHPAAAAGASVAIDGPGSNGCVPNAGGQGNMYCYTPNSVAVSSGSAVTWSNRSAVSHTVTRCTTSACGTGGGSGTAPPSFDSGTVNPGGQASISFSGAGSYVYYCTIHGYAAMHGTVTVTGPPPSPPTAPPPTARPPASAAPSTATVHAPSSPSPAQVARTSTSAAATSTGSAASSSANQPLAQASPSGSSPAPGIAATPGSTGGGAPVGLIIALVLLAAGGIGAGVTAWRRRAGSEPV